MSWLSKAAKKPLNTVAQWVNPVVGATQAVAGIDWKKQYLTGAAVGSGIGLMGMLGGAPGAAGPASGGAGVSSAGGLRGILGAQGFGGLGGALIGAGAGIYGANQQAKAQESANETNIEIAREQEMFSAAQAQKEMEFQERMSNTSYQRGVEDMKKAGINPIMAAGNGGASTPGGAMGSSAGATVEPVPSVVMNSLNSARDFLNTVQGIRESNSKIASNYASAGLSDASKRAKSFEIKAADTASEIFDKFKGKMIDTWHSAKKIHDMLPDLRSWGAMGGQWLDPRTSGADLLP